MRFVPFLFLRGHHVLLRSRERELRFFVELALEVFAVLREAHRVGLLLVFYDDEVAADAIGAFFLSGQQTQRFQTLALEPAYAHFFSAAHR